MTTSYNACVDYFLDSLTGRSPQTRRNYECDLEQFKLFPSLDAAACGDPYGSGTAKSAESRIAEV